MMQKNVLLFLILLYFSSPAVVQLTGSEKEVPQSFKSSNGQELASSSLYYKEGNKSLEWDFSPNSILDILSESVFTLNDDNGITLWIYDEKPQQDTLCFELYSPTGHVSYHFGFRLYSVGWRACQISFRYTQGDKKEKGIAGYHIVASNHTGRIFLDRLTFLVQKVNDRTTPDLQMSANDLLTYRDLWRWYCV